MQAKNIIADMFRNRLEIPSTEVEKRAEKMGIKEGTLKTVKKEGNYMGEKKKGENGEPDYWVWKKPYFKK